MTREVEPFMDMSLLLASTLVRAGRVRSYRIQRALTGWQVCAREDQQVVLDRHHDDWHRVEFALERFKREIAELRSQGWRDEPERACQGF